MVKIAGIVDQGRVRPTSTNNDYDVSLLMAATLQVIQPGLALVYIFDIVNPCYGQ